MWPWYVTEGESKEVEFLLKEEAWYNWFPFDFSRKSQIDNKIKKKKNTTLSEYFKNPIEKY